MLYREIFVKPVWHTSYNRWDQNYSHVYLGICS